MLSVRLWGLVRTSLHACSVTRCVGVKVQVCHVLVIVSHRLFTGALPNIVVARVWALFIQNCYTRLGLPSQGIRERPWQRDVEPWDDWSARVARVVGRGRRILLVPLQRPRAHDDRADGGEGTRGPGRVGDASESYPRGHLDGWMDGWMDGWTVGYQALPTSS